MDGVWEVPWILSMDVRNIKFSMQNRNVEEVHTFREGNKLADFLTNNVIHFAGIDTQRYFHIQELPQQARAFNWKRIKFLI
ncbi:hypothetical protein H5410_020806 [Solanum commersonii]|uniref:RNase H type-1 domain-containing protein n=1 Tax=Solanum commersonii TaxID=4109 RepID=A0A9J5ZAY9_SOLCO|nr:hypothetical protein H5410_020806 [Solanum commersonii]